MKVQKTTLCSLEQPYSVSPFVYQGRDCCLAASEGVNGPCKILSPEGVYTLQGALEGGCMNLVALPHTPDSFLTIQRFYPVFQSQNAKIVQVSVAPPHSDGTADCRVTSLCDVPFAHRIGLYQQEDELWLVAGVLCRSKAFLQDWSVPGYVAAWPLDPRQESVGKEEILLPVLHKNHGMATPPQSGAYPLLVSGEEGVFALRRNQKAWESALVLKGETSDLSLLDVDGDGQEELMVIQGFHGNALRVYHQAPENGWELFAEFPLAFGHVLWSGRIQGQPCALSGSREGRKELTLHRFAGGTVQNETIDEGGAPTQVAVWANQNGAGIYATNTSAGAIEYYQLS